MVKLSSFLKRARAAPLDLCFYFDVKRVQKTNHF